MREAKDILKSKGVIDPYIKTNISDVIRNEEHPKWEQNTGERMHTTPERGARQRSPRRNLSPPGKQDETSTKNRFSALEDSDGFWEDPIPELSSAPGIAPGKRARERQSPNGKSSPKRPSRREEPTEITQQLQIPQKEDINVGEKIESIITTGKRTSWSDMSFSDEIPSQELELRITQAKESQEQEMNDMSGVRQEVERYKESISVEPKNKDEREKEKDEIQTQRVQEDNSQHLRGCRCKICRKKKEEETEKMKQERNDTRWNENSNKDSSQNPKSTHDETCSCERCFYKEIRELKYKSNKNMSRVIERFISKPPEKDLKNHPRDCLCGIHMRNRITEGKDPYNKIIKQIVDNNFRL